MQRDQVRSVLEEQFNASLAESGVEITAVPAAQMQAIVQAMADGVFAVLDTLEEQNVPPASRSTMRAPAPPPADMPQQTPELGEVVEEVTLWHGRPYLTIGTRYELTNQRLRILRGILGNTIEEIELVRIKDTRVKQHMGERMINVGDVTVISADPTTPDFVLQNVRNPIDVRELIRKTVMEEKARRGLYYREDIGSAD